MLPFSYSKIIGSFRFFEQVVTQIISSYELINTFSYLYKSVTILAII